MSVAHTNNGAKAEVWTLFENVLKSAEGAKFNSPAQCAGSPMRWFFQALKGRNNLFRPFRAWDLLAGFTQRDALGYRMTLF
jgi:hypothetical protein